MTPLADILRRQIALTGPIPISEYMALCLLHPEHGYYTTRDPLGAAGDFTTAPEISQMFGELIGLALAQTWLDQGTPTAFALTELGPGRGTLMADILRATRQIPGFHDAAEVHLVETSLVLRDHQRRTIARDNITWHDSIDTLPDTPLFLVANEFFDALPIRQFIRNGEQWCERVIGLKQGDLIFGLSAAMGIAALDHRLEDTNDGDLVELQKPSEIITASIGDRIQQHGGTALIIDYGDWRSLGDTLQAMQDHASTNPLASPGNADLTAHVDFEALARATPSAHSRVTPQGVFLERLGITDRAHALASQLTGDALTSHIAAHRRLTHPDEMGTLFKVMALYPKAAAPPPGLNP